MVERESVNMVFIEDIVKTVKDYIYASTTFAEHTVRSVEDLSCVFMENTKPFVNIVQDRRYVNMEDRSIRVESVN